MVRFVVAAAALTLVGAAAPASEFTYNFTRETSGFYEVHTSGFAEQSTGANQHRDYPIQGVTTGTRTKADKGFVKLTIVQTLPDNTKFVNVEEKSNELGEVNPVLVTLPPDGALNFDRSAPVTEEERTMLHLFSPKFMPDNSRPGAIWQVVSLYTGEKDVSNYRLVKLDGDVASIAFDRTVEAAALGQNKVEAHGQLTFDVKTQLPITARVVFSLVGGGANERTTLDYVRQ